MKEVGDIEKRAGIFETRLPMAPWVEACLPS